MKKFLLSIYLLAATVISAADHPSTLAPVAELVGGTWLADVPSPNGGAALQLEANFEWAENGQAIRFHSSWVRDEKKSPYTSGFPTILHVSNPEGRIHVKWAPGRRGAQRQLGPFAEFITKKSLLRQEAFPDGRVAGRSAS